MKTTLNLEDKLLVRAKAAAARESISLTRMIEEGLVLRLRQRRMRRTRLPELPLSSCRGGLLPGIDPRSNRSMFDAADGFAPPAPRAKRASAANRTAE